MAIEMTRGADGSVMTMQFASDKTKAQYRLEALYSDAWRELTVVSSATLGDETLFEISVRHSSATQASLVVADFGTRFSGFDRAVLNVEPTARRGAAAVFGSIDDRSIAPFAVIDAPLSFTGRMVGPLRYADREALAVTSVGEGVGDALQPLSAVAKKDIGGFQRSGAGAGIFDTVSTGTCYGVCIAKAAFCAMTCGDDAVCHLMCAVSLGKCFSDCGK